MKRECETCIKRKIPYCPNSMDCMATDDMTYYQNRIMILEENQELKKQLKNCYCNRTDCSGRIKDSKQYDSLVQRVENQQKEFIEYLTLYIDALKNQEESVEGLDIGEEHILMTLEEILDKYKEIIGVSNDSKK